MRLQPKAFPLVLPVAPVLDTISWPSWGDRWPPDQLGSRPSWGRLGLCINIYIYILYYFSGIRDVNSIRLTIDIIYTDWSTTRWWSTLPWGKVQRTIFLYMAGFQVHAPILVNNNPSCNGFAAAFHVFWWQRLSFKILVRKDPCCQNLMVAQNIFAVILKCVYLIWNELSPKKW